MIPTINIQITSKKVTAKKRTMHKDWGWHIDEKTDEFTIYKRTKANIEKYEKKKK